MTETVYKWKLHKFQAFSRIFCSVGLAMASRLNISRTQNETNDQRYLTATLFIHETHIRYHTNKIVKLIHPAWMKLMITQRRNVSQTKICPSFPWQDAWHTWPSDKWWSGIYQRLGMSSRQSPTMGISVIIHH